MIAAPLALATGAARLTRLRSGADRLSRVLFAVLLLLYAGHQLGAFTQVRNSATALDQNWANHEAVGKHLADLAAEITLAGSESGKIAYAFGGRYFDISGLHDQRIARLARQANADQRFRDYLLESYGLPDVYVDPEAQYWYARMSNQPELAQRYVPVAFNGLSLYLRKDSPHLDEIRRNLTGG